MKICKLFLPVVLLFCSSQINAQEIAISTTTLEGCGGFLVDTGLSAGDYGNNEEFTMTLCAEEPDTIINLAFNLFALGEGDQMTIYDGPDTDSPLIGTYVLDDIIGQDITSTNEDGCLTLYFTSDDSDVGSFTAEISCGMPCIQPLAQVVVDQDAPYKICVGEELTFDASSSIFAPGTALDSLNWIFGDGEENSEDWPMVTHSYDIPGAYVVDLDLKDDNECENTNVLGILVEVSTTPTFEVGESTIFCEGEEVSFTAQVIPTLWDGSTGGITGGELFIPDDQTTCFGSEISFANFPPGSVIDEVSDFENFFINFEHSFMGDLTVSFECPEGNTISVHQQGGGGTFLGEPVDNDADLTPGVGYDYYWSPEATLGTWDEEAGFGTLPSDTYNSVQSWDALLGCSLNGTWSIQICDSWGSDNGYIFDWSLEFDESFYDEDLSFTPSFGMDCDSTYWLVDEIDETMGPDCNMLTLDPSTDPGTYTYEFEAIDDFGCSYSTEVEIFIYEQPELSVGPDVEYCAGDTIIFNSEILNPEVTLSDLIYTWSPDINITDTSAVNPEYFGGDIVQEYVLTVTSEQAPTCTDTDEFVLTVFPLPETTVVGEDEICANATTTLSITDTFPEVFWNDDPNISGPTFEAPPGEHVVIFTDDNTCVNSVIFVVDALPVPGLVDLADCSLELDIDDEPDDFPGQWQSEGPGVLTYSNPTGNNSLVTATEYGVYTVSFIDDLCSVDTEVTFTFLETPVLTVGDDVTYCEGDFIGFTADFNDEDYPFTDWTYSWSPGTDLNNTNIPNPNYNGGEVVQEYELDLESASHPLCAANDAFVLTVLEAPFLEILGEDMICSNATTTLTISDVYPNIEWDNDPNLSGVSIDAAPGSHSVTVYEIEGCESTFSFDINALPTPVLNDHSVCGINFQLEDDATTYNGSWSTEGPGTLSYFPPTSNNANVSASEYGIYNSTYTDNCGIENTILLSFLPNPLFALEDDEFCIDDDLDYVIQPIGQYPELFSWTWNGVAGGPTTIFDETGSYDFVATNQCGLSEGSAFFEAIPCDIVVPNVFTPDTDDEFNEYFVITGLEFFPGSKLSVYNRWGKLIYENSNYKNKWKPTVEDASEGTYYWILDVNKDSGVESLSGHLTILRDN